MEKAVILKRGKDMPIMNRHHWIFSGAIDWAPQYENGDILPVYSFDKQLLGHAYFNHDTVIAGRMINFSNQDPLVSLKENIAGAIELRKSLFQESKTNCYRVINGEGDYISGLVVDRYADVLVIQIVSTGIDRLRDYIIKSLIEVFEKTGIEIKCVYEKSTIHARMKDGLKPVEKIQYGEMPEQVVVLENEVKFIVDIINSQKTGLFLDQREMRKLVGELAEGKNILNCFGYTGGFSLYASKNGAKSVTTVDIAPEAIALAEKNFEINDFDKKNHKFITDDAFVFLHDEPLDYDFIILDPPAFAKKKDDIERAKRGYGDINRTTLRKMKPQSYLLTCSCSYHVPQELFEQIVMRAARDAKRSVRIIHKHRLAMDHPINIFHSEIDYLKSLLLFVE